MTIFYMAKLSYGQLISYAVKTSVATMLATKKLWQKYRTCPITEG